MSVAYTIKRNGYYHINVRIGSHIFRKSLATDSRKIAQIMVDKFIPIVTTVRDAGDTSDEQILATLSKLLAYLVEQVRKRFNAVIYPLSSEANDELSDFQDSLIGALNEVPSSEYPDDWKEFILSQIDNPEAFRKELLSKIAPLNTSDNELVKQFLEHIIDSEDPLYDRATASFLKVFGEFRKIRIALEYNNEPSARSMIEKLSSFAESTKDSWKYIEKDNEEEHALLLGQSSIVKSVKQNQHNTPNSLTNVTLERLFNEYIDDNTNHWDPKILADNKRKSDLLLTLLGRNKLISQVSGQELDDALSIALSMPRRNTYPYSKYTTEKCVSVAQLDEIDDDVRVSPKTIKEHKKFLQSCFKFARYKRYISISPTDNMLLRFSKSSTRGCFSNSQVFENEDSPYVVQAFSAIRKPLSEKFSDSVCIWWLRSINKYGTLQPMFQIFSTQKLNKEAIENITARLDNFPLYTLRQRVFLPQQLENWCDTVKKQRLHDIQRLYEKDWIKRWAVTNKKAAKQLDDNCS